MIRTLAYVAASLLLIGTAYAEDKTKSDEPQKKPEAKAEAATKESTEPKTEPTSPRGGRRPGMRGDAPGHRGKVTKASLENGVLKLQLDGKDYEFAVGDQTHAFLRTAEKDGKEVVEGVWLSNGGGRGAAARTRPGRKPKTE